MPPALQTISRNQYAPFFGGEKSTSIQPKNNPCDARALVKSLARNPTVRDELLMAELNDFKGSIAIVVSSCDAFFDAWRPFAAFLQKFWADCPLEIFLITNELELRSSRIRALAVGEDRGWSSNFLPRSGRRSHTLMFSTCRRIIFSPLPVQKPAAGARFCRSR